MGSSPLTRGKLIQRKHTSQGVGLIPAHAGKTATAWTRDSAAWAHPRSRGENKAYEATVEAPGGSSPLTRGKRGVLLRTLSGPGLIPAHAGKTLLPAVAPMVRVAHPRSRGENGLFPLGRGPGAGSSPLTRGKRGRARVHRARPAAHPRSRGENSGARSGLIKAAGSSPLTRGKLGPRGPHGDRRRLIPAHAGKTG